MLELTTSTRGFVTHGSEKGYAFDEGSPRGEPLLPDLDGITEKQRGAGRRKLGDGWFLYSRGD